MPAPDLKPLAMGELIDRSVTFWRAHWKTLFRLYLALELIVYAILKTGTLIGQRQMPWLYSTPLLTQAAQDPEKLPQLGSQLAVAGFGFAAMLIVDFWLAWWFTAAGSRFCVALITGQDSTLKSALAHARARTGALTVSFLLSLLMWMLAGLLLALPGLGVVVLGAVWGGTGGSLVVILGAVLWGLGEAAAVLWYVVRFLFTAPVIANEEVGALGALRRSNQLVSGKVGPGLAGWVKVRATILLTAILLIRTVISLLAGLPAMIVQLVYGNAFSTQQDLNAIPQYLLIPAELINVVAQSVFSPLYLVFAAIFYLDIRVRREGLDLELKLGASRAA